VADIDDNGIAARGDFELATHTCSAATHHNQSKAASKSTGAGPPDGRNSVVQAQFHSPVARSILASVRGGRSSSAAATPTWRACRRRSAAYAERPYNEWKPAP